jgi:hypothetical protein
MNHTATQISARRKAEHKKRPVLYPPEAHLACRADRTRQLPARARHGPHLHATRAEIFREPVGARTASSAPSRPDAGRGRRSSSPPKLREADRGGWVAATLCERDTLHCPLLLLLRPPPPLAGQVALVRIKR